MDRELWIIKKSSIESFLLILVLYILIPPTGLRYILGNIDKINQVFLALIVVYLIIISITKKKKITTITILLLLLNSWLAYSTFLSKPEYVSTAIWNLIRVVAICLMFEVYNDKINLLIRAYSNFFFSAIFFNFITIVLTYPSGLFTRIGGSGEYFLGYRNAFVLFFIPALFFSLLDYYKRKKMNRILSIYGICLASFLIEKSSTGLVVLITFIFVFFVINSNFKIKNSNYTLKKNGINWIFGAYIGMNIALLLSNAIFNSKIFSYIVENVLGKTLTLTGRTNIWKVALLMISSNPIRGYGIGNNVNVSGTIWYGHNQIIELLLEGGMVALILFGVMIIYLIKKTKQTKILAKYKVAIQVMSMLFIFFLTEANTLQYFVPIYVLIANFEEYSEKTLGSKCR